jgi:hypothetical protein
MQPTTPDLLTRAGPAATLAARLKLSDEAKALLRPEMTARQYLDAVVAANHHPDAIRLLSRALPRREAVWWACQCVRAAATEEIPAADSTALLAAEKWASSATEDHRRAAFTAGEATEFDTPAGLCCVAAFWSGGSLAPPKLAVVAPAEHLCPDAVANAVLLAGLLPEPDKAEAKNARFVALGTDVAEGRNRWQEERPATPGARPAARRP